MSTFDSENRLLAALNQRDRNRLLKRCKVVTLAFGDVLHEPGQPIRYVYFPLDTAITLLMPFDQGDYAEVDLIGNEGMFGIPVVLGVPVSPLRAVVQGSGKALRLSAASLRDALELSGQSLRRKLNAYVYVRLAQLAQTSVCASVHVVEERLARWLLMTRDRAQADEFYLTHEFLAQMLGVRRVGITKAAGSLRQRKLVSYSRGDIAILDRRGLEAASCSCYQASLDTYDRIFG